MLKRMDAVLNHARGQFFAEHVCFFLHNFLIFVQNVSIMHGPYSSLVHFQRCILISQPLSLSGDLGTPLIPLVLFAILSSCMLLSHASLLTDFFFPSLLSPTLISCCQRNSKCFLSCAHQSRDVTCRENKCRICFCPEAGQRSNHQEGLVCLLSAQ